MMKQTYKEYRQQLKDEQEGMTEEQLVDHLKSQKDTDGQPLYSHILDINNLPPQEHHWVERGVVVSCEGAGHMNHQYYKRVSA